MNFEEKYPNAKYLEEVEEGIIKGKESQPCWNCEKPTSFVEINFEAYLCSNECVKIKWDEYKNAYKEEK